MERRQQLTDAALRVVAARGLKGLTHRAVDAEAALPQGSTSNLFRTRELLISGLVQRLVELDQQAWAAAPLPTDLASLLVSVVELPRVLVTDHPTLLRVRLALSLEYPDLVRAGHLHLVEQLTMALTAFEVSDPSRTARALADYLDGLMLHLITVRREGFDVEEAARVVRQIVGST